MHCILVVQLLRKHGFQFLLTGSSSVSAETGLAVESQAASTSEPSPMSNLFPNVLPASATSQSFERNVRPGAVGDWRGFKKLLYATVLSTDMSLHFDWLKRFNDLGKRARAGLCVDMSEAEEEEARTLACQSLIKCADISNPVSQMRVKGAFALTGCFYVRLVRSKSASIGRLCYWTNGLCKHPWSASSISPSPWLRARMP